MIKALAAKWNTVRVLRLVLSLAFIMTAVKDNEWWAWIPGVVLLLQAVLNTGCGCATSCSTPFTNPEADLGVLDVEYEEVH